MSRRSRDRGRGAAAVGRIAIPLAAAGLAIQIPTGLVLLAVEATKLGVNPAFYAKIALHRGRARRTSRSCMRASARRRAARICRESVAPFAAISLCGLGPDAACRPHDRLSLTRPSRCRPRPAKRSASLRLARRHRPVTKRNILAVVLWMRARSSPSRRPPSPCARSRRRCSVFEMLALRNAAGVAILLALALPQAGPAARAAAAPLAASPRCATWCISARTYAWALGVTLLPLATVFALEFTTPAWVALLAVLLPARAPDAERAVAAVALGFVGVLRGPAAGRRPLQPARFVVLGARSASPSRTSRPRSSPRPRRTFCDPLLDEPDPAAVEPRSAARRAFWHEARARSNPAARSASASAGCSSHYCLTNAYRHGDAIMVMPLDFLRIPLIALVGWRLYGEPLDPFVLRRQRRSSSPASCGTCAREARGSA